MSNNIDEREMMLAGKLYDSTVPHLVKERDECNEKIMDFNAERNSEKRMVILKTILGKLGTNSCVLPPFHVDYGKYVEIGDNTFINYNCTILDASRITIGNHVLLGPNVQLIGATHPTDPHIRNDALLEYGGNITIKDGAWLGAGCIILPGITIGENSVVGAGAVVTKDVPDNVVVVGNPARILKKVANHEGWTREQRDIPID